MKRTRTLLPIILALGACTAVGPNYTPPEIAVNDAWSVPADTREIDPTWWRQFGDPKLTRIIEHALANSPTIAEAQAQLTEARANRDAVFGLKSSQVTAAGSATQNRISEDGQIPAGQIPSFSTGYGLFDLGFDTSWEVDFWGRRVREAEGAEARVGVVDARLHDVLVLLTAEIARNYIDLRAAQADVGNAQSASDAWNELARLTALRHRWGESSKLEAVHANAAAAAASAAIIDARKMEDSAAYRIAALVGVAPEAIVPDLRVDADLPAAPESLFVGLRSDLLRRRPDVRTAERELAAAIADIGVSTADLFPRFSLMSGLGAQSRSVDGLLDLGSVRFSVGPSFSWPIFSVGRIRAQVRAADARAEAAAAHYEQAVAEALADSEGAINRYLESQRAELEARRALAARLNAYALAEQRFTSGEDDKLARERAKLELAAGQRAANAARAETARAAVAVFKSLGGAWKSDATEN